MTDGTSSAFSRVERYARIGSTNDVVREWLADGVEEICVAVAGEQTAGRGRHGRTWTAPPGAAVLCSLGFRPTWSSPDRAWRVAATIALAMADAAEDIAGLPIGAIRLKWPNDLVIETGGPNALLVGELSAQAATARLAAPLALRKLAGVLGESQGLGTDDPRVIVGIGINGDWAAADFPPELAPTMTSLREASGGRPIDATALFDASMERVEVRVAAFRGGVFDVASWTERQATTGRFVTLDDDEATRGRPVRALGVDAASGALAVEDGSQRERLVHAGEVTRVRVAPEQV
ncbi:MAG TPA: biotin--[acetyl-CoA-carboxylase] ligase [Candidatus Limnocylindrales bacterium]|nr:biotin--[acetyl-CoA-carboxylase] ligase [Candidatus Limnocylindrales bacterium]